MPNIGRVEVRNYQRVKGSFPLLLLTPTTIYLETKTYFFHSSVPPPSRKIFPEPLNPLPLRIIHRLLILLATPIAPQRKPMHLILVNPYLMRDIRLLGQHVLNLSHAAVVQQAVFVS